MGKFAGLLVLLFVLLLPALFAALIWGVAFFFNPPQGVGDRSALPSRNYVLASEM